MCLGRGKTTIDGRIGTRFPSRETGGGWTNSGGGERELQEVQAGRIEQQGAIMSSNLRKKCDWRLGFYGTRKTLPEYGSFTLLPEAYPVTSTYLVGSYGLKTYPGLSGTTLAVGNSCSFEEDAAGGVAVGLDGSVAATGFSFFGGVGLALE
jgi:hypothetical protein